MQHLEYTVQEKALSDKLKLYNNAQALADQYQEAVVELLQQHGRRVEIFPLSLTSRPTLLHNLALSLERGEIRYPATALKREKAGLGKSDPYTDQQRRFVTALDGEIENFTPQVTKHGTVRYEAAHNYHDDLIFALAMANEAGKRRTFGGGGGFLVTS